VLLHETLRLEKGRNQLPFVLEFQS
jgi:hypothetical protein